MDDVKYIGVTRQDAELILDSFKMSNPVTRNLCLKVAAVCVEFAADEAGDQAAALAKGGKVAERPGWMREGAD